MIIQTADPTELISPAAPQVSGTLPSAGRVVVVGEIGINHNGDIDTARRLIDVAHKAGCDLVKFQKRSIDIVYSPEVLEQPRQSPWGHTQRDQKEGLEFSETQYDLIDAHCKDIGIDWFASAWDLESQKFLGKYNCKYNKIASAMTVHSPFVEAVAAEGKLTFMSTGMCTLEDVDTAVAILNAAQCPFVLMHTVSTYPTPPKDLNLRTLLTLSERYGAPVGYSGHETNIEPTLIAVMLGAVVVERHLTLDRTMYGSDQAASLEPDELARLVAAIRALPEWLGDGLKRMAPGEAAVADKLRYWRAR